MIRAVYRWSVAPGSEYTFTDWWHAGTLTIRNEHVGALGSMLLRSHDDPTSFIGIARWATKGDLETFWAVAKIDGLIGVTMTSVETFEEVDDLVIDGPAGRR